MNKSERQVRLLEAMIEEYIKTARPVSSQQLVDVTGSSYSSATIRNDMAALEEEGFIHQPHTSAGRVPTERGYQFYIRNFLENRELGKPQKRRLARMWQQTPTHDHQFLKDVGKTLADITQETVVIATEDGTIFAGIAHLFHKPEFTESEQFVALSEAFDRFDAIMTELITATVSESAEPQVLIGHENPFFDECAMILSTFASPQHSSSVFTIVGPMRMDYERNIAIMHYLEELTRSEF